MKFILSSIFLIYSQYLFAQNTKDYLHFFPDSIVQKASKISPNLPYNDMEKEVFLLTNLARMAPKEFISLLNQYLKDSDSYSNNNPYVNSLRNELMKKKANPNALLTHHILREVATAHAAYNNRTHTTGHQDSNKRALTVEKSMHHYMYAENCAYYYNSAIDLLMGLLIDNGIRSVGHRRTILNDYLTHLGISIIKEKNGEGYIMVESFSAE
ncbi:MAG: CAP domain-containing protein [Chitinophagales bacterium]|nr:CAP domain-containing protein [Chitinophagales bacterium]